MYKKKIKINIPENVMLEILKATSSRIPLN